jgi:hypothetical protein
MVGQEDGSEVDISIQEIVDAEIDGEVPSPQSSPRRVHSFLRCRELFLGSLDMFVSPPQVLCPDLRV